MAWYWWVFAVVYLTLCVLIRLCTVKIRRLEKKMDDLTRGG